jgi:hypothetical protein
LKKNIVKTKDIIFHGATSKQEGCIVRSGATHSEVGNNFPGYSMKKLSIKRNTFGQEYIFRKEV